MLLLCQSDGGLWGLRLRSTRAWGLGFTGKALVVLSGSLGIRAYHTAPHKTRICREKIGCQPIVVHIQILRFTARHPLTTEFALLQRQTG